MTSVTTTQHNIKHRLKPNDKIYTPKALVKLHIGEVGEYLPFPGEPVPILDPCAGDGAYYRGFKETYGYGIDKQFEEGIKFEENEITKGKDFFKNNNEKYDIIIGNLPFSLTEKFLKKSAELNPVVISYLMPMYGLTAARQEMMEDYGYKLAKIKQFKWYVCMGMCGFVTWVKKDFGIDDKVEVTYDRTVWYKIDVWAKKKAKQRDRDLKKKWKEEEKRVKKQRALLKRVAKSAASIGKKKHNTKWWCETMEIFSKVPTYKITCDNDMNPFHIQDEMWKWSYKTKYPKSGRKLWGELINGEYWNLEEWKNFQYYDTSDWDWEYKFDEETGEIKGKKCEEKFGEISA